jgi:hypothetical protein
MAISLSSLSSPSNTRPLIFTIVSDGGMGKTTLASLFPRPVFIRTEDGTQSIANRKDIALFPVASSIAEVMEAIQTLRTEKHKFSTLVIDSVTKFNIMVESEVLASDPRAKGLNQAHGGYGNAFDMVSKLHRDLREMAGALSSERGMHIVFIAHAATEMVDLPDADPFMRYSIPMHRKSIPHYTNDVEVVAYIKQKTYTTGEGDKKKAVTDGSRIITCYPTPSHVSKNRLGISADMIFEQGVNPFDAWLNKSNEIKGEDKDGI